MIYIITGTGRVMVGDDVQAVRAGTTVLFPRGVVHMLHNTGGEEMKVVCFFAPATNLENYKKTFGMVEVKRLTEPGQGRGIFLSDGHINLAILYCGENGREG